MAVFTIAGAPGVPDGPVLGTLLLTVADNGDRVVDSASTGRLLSGVFILIVSPTALKPPKQAQTRQFYTIN